MTKILLAAAESLVAQNLRDALYDSGGASAEIAAHASLAQTLAHVEAFRPDAIILDENLPDLGGMDGLARACACAPDVAVILLSARDDARVHTDAIRCGAQDCLTSADLVTNMLPRLLRQAIERKRWEGARCTAVLREHETRLRTVTDNMPALIAYVDGEQRYRFVNQFHEEWFGQSVADLTGKTMRDVMGDDDYENCQDHIQQALTGRRVAFEQRIIRNTFERFLHIVYVPEYDAARRVIGFYVLGNDVTERKLNEARLESIALYDPLTGLANRLLLADRVTQAIAHAQRHSTNMALIYMDLDGFKQVNDTLGHDAGDLLLREVAERLVGSLRQEDTVARLGGDEFVIAIWQVSAPADVSRLAAKLIAAVSQPYFIGTSTINVTASAGISLYPAQGASMETLLKSADVAMYEAKRSGKNTYRLYDSPPQAMCA